MGIHSMGRPEIPCSQRPTKPVVVRRLRDFFEFTGRGNWMVTLVPVEGGYTFRAHPTYGYKESQVIVSEKSRKVRIFRNIESAMNLARSYGFTEVAVELNAAGSAGLCGSVSREKGRVKDGGVC